MSDGAFCIRTGKVRYENQKAVMAAMHGMGRKNPHVPYRCPDCGGWHMGTRYKNKRGNPRDVYSRNRKRALS
jgi:hypothetical protein